MKRKLTAVFTFILGTLMTTNVYASSSIGANLSSNEVELSDKEGFIVTLKLDDYKWISDGIYAYKTTLEYDDNIFETLEESDFTGLNDWEDIYYNPSTKELIALNKNGSKGLEDVLEINFRVKENAPAGITQISVLDISGSEGINDISINDASINVEVIKNEEDRLNDISTSQDVSLLNKEDTIIKENKNYIYLIFIIEVIIMLFIIFKCRNNKKLSKRLHKIILTLFLLAFTLFISSTSARVIKYFKNGEINYDGKIDYQDVNLLEKDLIHLIDLTSDQIDKSDLNSDGKINVTDVVLLMKKIEKLSNYKVSLDNISLDNYYVNKGDDVTLTFTSNVTNDEKIKKITINNKEYNVIKVSDNKYQVNLKAATKAGIDDYNIGSVLLNNGKRVKVDYKESIIVLKEVPTISNYLLNDNINDSSISFDIVDNDDSMITSNIIVLDKDTKEEVLNKEVTKGTNNVKIETSNHDNYEVKILYSYDLAPSSNALEDYKNNVEYVKEFQSNFNYNFLINDISYEDYYKLNEDINIEFTSTNNSIYEPNKIKINGTYYDVFKNDNKYRVKINGFSKLGLNNVNIEEVILENGKDFIVDNNFNIDIIKNNPTINISAIEEDKTNNLIKTYFEINDQDNTIKNIKVVLYDDLGKKIDSEVITESDVKNKKFEKILKLDEEDNYIVKVIASYETNELYENVVLLETKFKKDVTAKIVDSNLSCDYVNKGDDFTIYYEIKTNDSSKVSKILVNSVFYNAKYLEDNKYAITIKAKNIAGIEDIHTTKLVFNDGSIVNIDNHLQIEVLKSVPTILETNQSDDVQNKSVKISFLINDEDKAYISGKVELINNKNKVIDEENILSSNNEMYEVIFNNLDLNTNYTLRFVIAYSKYQDNTIEYLTIDKEIELLASYDLEIDNIDAYKKNEDIYLSFTSTNKSSFNIEKVIINDNTYNVLQNRNNTYLVEISGYNSSEFKKIKIQGVILSNQKIILVNDKSIEVKIND